MILFFALTITSTCIKAYEDIIGKRSAVYAAFSDISRFMVDCLHPAGQLWIALINGSQHSKVILKVMQFL